jgi:hypothetical protein
VSACANCGVAYADDALACPYCRAPRGLAGLARAGQAADDDRLVRIDSDALLARSDARLEDLLARDLAGPLAPGDLRDALDRVDERLDPSVGDLERALADDAAIALDGITLADLVADAPDDVKVLRRGLAFLKNRRYREALEWWTLHREQLDPARERLGLLLLLMEGFTHRLAGDPRRAAEVKARITAHPLYRRMRGLARTGTP